MGWKEKTGEYMSVDQRGGALYFGHGKVCPSLNDHSVFIKFLHVSSLGGMDPSFIHRIDYRGVSEEMQPTDLALDDTELSILIVKLWGYDMQRHQLSCTSVKNGSTLLA